MKIYPIWSPVKPSGQKDGQTDMTKLIIAFRACVDASKKCKL